MCTNILSHRKHTQRYPKNCYALIYSTSLIKFFLVSPTRLCIHLTSLGMPDPAFFQCLGVTRATLTPSLLVNLLHCNAPILSRGQLRFCLCSGETLSFITARTLLMRAPLCTIIHLYGSTEVSGDASWTTLTTGDLEYGKTANLDIVPLGKPLPGTRMWLVGSETSTKLEVGQIGMPVDMNGELWVEGPGVALGYYGKQGIHSNFVAKERDGHPVFKTGDLVRCISDTTNTSLYFLHRRDSSAKVRGVWIHLEEGERELALALGLNSKEELGLSVVSSNTDTENSELLIALTWKAAQSWPNLPKLRQRLIGRGISPELMPTRIVIGMKDQLLPLTSNGKLDRQMLSTWGSEVASRCTSYAEMVRSRFKDDSSGYWLEFCFSKLVGTQDENHIGLGLFQRGGHSLLAMQALYHIERHFKAASAGVMIEDMARPVAEISKKIGKNRDTLPRKRGRSFTAETISDRNQLPTMLQAWTFEFEKCVDAQPCVVSLDNGERLIIVGSHDHYIAALEANTGKVKWRSRTSGRIEGKVAVQNDLIFVPCLDYRLYAFSLVTGELAWTFITQGELKCTPLPLWLPSPTHDESKGISLVLFGSYDGRIYVVEASSGACFAKPFPLQGSPYASPIVIPGEKRNSDSDERIITVTNRGRVAQLKLEREGMVLKGAHLRWALHSDWEQEIGCAVFTTPVYSTTTAYLVFGGTDGAVVALDPFHGGSIVWRILLDQVQSSPIFISPCLMPRNSETEIEFVLIACQTSLYCIQTSSGKHCWKRKLETRPDEVITGQPTFLEGSLIVLLTTQFGKLLLLNLDSELDAVDTGTRELILTGESRLTSPAIITLPKETVFPYRKSWQCSIGSRDNKVYMINISG